MSKTVVASLSGGQDSTAMIVGMLENGEQLDHILFCDTGAEHDVMYEYLKKLDAWLYRKFQKSITWLNGETYEDVVKHVKTVRSKYEGRPKGITSYFMVDECTRKLKVERSEKFIKNDLGLNLEDVIQCHGYTYDEVKANRGGAKDHLATGNYRYPLHEWGWNEPQVAKYLQDKSIFNPLYKHYTRTGCFLCPKQGDADWFVLWKHYRKHWEYAKKLEKWCFDNNAVQKFFFWDRKKEIGVPLEKVEKRFEWMDKQQVFDFQDERSDISCFCK